MAIAGLVCGIVAIPFALIPIAGVILAILGIVFGAIGMRRAKRGQGAGKGMAIAGLVLGVVAILASIVVAVVTYQQVRDCEDAIGHKPSSSELQQCIKDGV